eukprot:gene12846-9185_t
MIPSENEQALNACLLALKEAYKPVLRRVQKEKYSKNEFPEPPSASWLELFLKSFEDSKFSVLVVAAIVLLAVGVYEDPHKGWIEGVAILSAVPIVVVVTATNDYNKKLKFRNLNIVKEDVTVVDHFKANYVALCQRFDANRGDRLITFSSSRTRMPVVSANGKGTTSGRSGII